MRATRILTTVFALSLAVHTLAGFSGAVAQTSNTNTRFSLVVSPPVTYIQLKPGSKSSHTITLKNTGQLAVEVFPTVVDFKPDGTSGAPVLQETTSFQYLQVPSTGWPTIQLKPQQTAQLTLHFVVPAEAIEKEYPLTVLFAQKPLQTSAGSAVTGTVGSNVIVLVSAQNHPKPDLTVTSFGVFPLIDMFSSISLEPIVTNNGFSAQPISGTLTIRNWRGATLKTFALFPDVVLGNSSRYVRGQSEAATDDDVPDPVELTYEPEWLFGIYQIDLDLTYLEPGTETQPVYLPLASHRLTVVAFPYVLLSVLVVSSIFIAAYHWSNARRIRL